MNDVSIWYWAAAGMGFAVGSKLTRAVLNATVAFLAGAAHGKFPRIFPCPLCHERAPCGEFCQCPVSECEARRTWLHRQRKKEIRAFDPEIWERHT